MKQGTLFAVFSKTSTFNGNSNQLGQPVKNSQVTKLDGSTLIEDTPNDAGVSSSLVASVVKHDDGAALTKMKSHLQISEVEQFGEKVNIKKRDRESKQAIKTSLSLSVGKRSLKMGKRNSAFDLEMECKSTAGDDCSSLSEECSIIEESTENVPDTKLCLGAEKKVKDSMQYEDFIAQLSQQNEPEIEQDSQTNQNNETKIRTMSYSDFLGMFKSPPKEEDSKPADDEIETEKRLVPEIENQKEVRCKSIASYFSKSENKSRQATVCSTTVTVSAEIHSPSQVVNKSTDPRSSTIMNLSKKKEKMCRKASDADKSEIEFLSSETITEMEADLGKKNLTMKRRNNEPAALPLQISKKPKVELQSKMPKKQNLETQVEISKKQNEKSIKGENVQGKGVITKFREEISNKKDLDSANTEEIEQVTPATLTLQTLETSQSTLCFGKERITLIKSIDVDDDISTDEEYFDAKKVDKRQTKRLSSKPKTDSNNTTNNRNINEPNDVKDDDYPQPCEDRNKSQHKRENLGLRDPLLAAATAQLPMKKDIKEDGTGASNESIHQNTVETCILRRSARLTQSAQTMKDVDVVEIGSDSDEDVMSRETKKRCKKGGTQRTLADGGSPADNSSKKALGKIAPIFTSVKSKEQVGKSVAPAVDPEQDRLRREFLMSGIPEELKRQIATTNSNVLLDYPPFPDVSHVQQIQNVDCLSATVVVPRFRYTADDENYEIFHNTPLLWKDLASKHTDKIENLPRDQFEKFTTNSPPLSSQLDLLLKELQCNDDQFPFKRTYTHLHSNVAPLEVSSPSDDVMIIEDDDDVVIVDDSSPVSERIVLNHTSESKALLWSDLHQPDNSEHIIGNTKAMKHLKRWLEEWKVLVEKQVWKASRISKRTSKSKGKGGWSDDSDFIDSEEEEMALCNSVLITGPHGVGKTASVYALAKELGYKVFEVNSSSLRSGKQLLAQLEEATQSHTVAQNKMKSAMFLDTPPTGTLSNKTEVTCKELKHSSKTKPASSVNLGFANLFHISASEKQDTNSHSGTKIKGNKLKLSVPVNTNKSGNLKNINVKPADLKMAEPFPIKTSRKEKSQVKEEICTTKAKKNRSKEDTNDTVIKKRKGTPRQQLDVGVLEVKSQTNNDYNLTSGSLNLTSVSLILFDEVDVVFDEDKGFLATVQHFMMSTKIPIVLTSTNFGFHRQLHARHDLIRLYPPPLVSAASFLSTVCLTHGVRVDHQSVLNAIRYMKGDVRRCLLYLQYWCESGGGIVQIARKVDQNSLSASVNTSRDVVEKLITHNHSKKFGSMFDSSEDSSECEFICLRPPKKKARQKTSDDDSSHDTTSLTFKNSNKSTKEKSKVVEDGPLEKNKSKVILNRKENIEDAANKHQDDLPPVHVRFEESFLGLYNSGMSATAVLDFITMPTLSCVQLDSAVQTCSIINQALSIDVIYQIVLHSLPLPKCDGLLTQLTLPAKHEAPTPETTSCQKSRKRIIQGDWLNSDSSDDELHQVNNLTQHSTKNEQNYHADNIGSSWHNKDISCEPGHEKGLTEKSSIKKKVCVIENDSQKTQSKFTGSVLSEFTRFYDNLSFIDCLEAWPVSDSHLECGIKLIPGLSDENLSKLSDFDYEDRLHHISGPVRILAARKFCSSVGELVNSSMRPGSSHTDLENNQSVSGGTVDLTELSGEFHLPVQKLLPDLWSIAEKEQSQRLSREPAYKNVSKCLGLTVQSSIPSLNVDYLPYLREICRQENERQLAKNQRRFHHYLDNIGLGLKESTIASLTSTYVVSSDNRET